MRPGQNKRMRGRPTNNRRGPNPLTRSYESNGPDVKIRGNAHHVAEKYLQLARDAHTGGDPVAAENYLQHAEHYFRLIAAAQAAQALAQSGRPPGEGDADDAEDDDDGGVLDRFASPAERVPVPFTPPPQPYPQQPSGAGAPYNNYGDRQPYEGERPQQNDRNNGYQQRQDRQGQNRHQQDRGPRPDRPYQDRQEGQRDNRGPNDGRQRDFRPYRDNNGPRDNNPAREPQPNIEIPSPTALPAFITAAPRLVVGSESPDSSPQPMIEPIVASAAEGVEASAPQPDISGEPRFPRGRRRRLRSPYGFHGAGGDDASPAQVEPGEPPVSE